MMNGISPRNTCGEETIHLHLLTAHQNVRTIGQRGGKEIYVAPVAQVKTMSKRISGRREIAQREVGTRHIME